MGPLELVIVTILIALVFDFLNGFHDAANSIATVVSTRVLSPKAAVLWAAWWNFAAAFGFGVSVAKTIAVGVVASSAVNIYVVLSGLVGAIVWDLVTWYYGLPTSSSHALIGGFVGAAVMSAGLESIILSGVTKIVIFMVVSPALGLVFGFALMILVMHLFAASSPRRVDRYFRKLQLASAGLYSLGHGTNDAQKTMGIITALLLSAGLQSTDDVQVWVILAAHAAIAAGTLAGGWRIVKTMGMRITKLRPVGGFCAETAGATTLIGTAIVGIPISTTHTIAGAIMGVGATVRLTAVRWGVARRIVWAWILTMPASALVSMLFFYVLQLFIQ